MLRFTENIAEGQQGQAPVSEKQVNARYAIGKRKELDRTTEQAWVQAQIGTELWELSSRVASALISQWLDI